MRLQSGYNPRMSIDSCEPLRAGRPSDCRRRLLGLAACLLVVVVMPGCATLRAANAYQRGSAALDRGDSVEAIAELERAADWLPHASEIQNHLGIAYSMGGRRDDALAAFRRAVELDCDNLAAQRNLAESVQHEVLSSLEPKGSEMSR